MSDQLLQRLENRRKCDIMDANDTRRKSMDFREMLYITTVADWPQHHCRGPQTLYLPAVPQPHRIQGGAECGVKLFDRGTSPLTITYAGEKYVETARKILLMSDNLRKELIDADLGKKAVLCLACRQSGPDTCFRQSSRSLRSNILALNCRCGRQSRTNFCRRSCGMISAFT